MREPSPVEVPSGPPNPGLALPVAVFRNPAQAFAMVATSHEWLPAYIVLVAMDLVALYLQAPAMEHVVRIQAQHIAQPQGSDVVTRWFELQVIATLVIPFLQWGFVAMLMTAIAVVSRGAPLSFATYFSLCINCALPAQVGGLFYAAATRVAGPSGFRTFNDLATALPLSLAALRPHGSAPEITFLSYWDLFTLWSLVLLGCGYAAIAKVRLVPALLLALGVGMSIALSEVAAG